MVSKERLREMLKPDYPPIDELLQRGVYVVLSQNDKPTAFAGVKDWYDEHGPLVGETYAANATIGHARIVAQRIAHLGANRVCRLVAVEDGNNTDPPALDGEEKHARIVQRMVVAAMADAAGSIKEAYNLLEELWGVYQTGGGCGDGQAESEA